MEAEVAALTKVAERHAFRNWLSIGIVDDPMVLFTFQQKQKDLQNRMTEEEYI